MRTCRVVQVQARKRVRPIMVVIRAVAVAAAAVVVARGPPAGVAVAAVVVTSSRRFAVWKWHSLNIHPSNRPCMIYIYLYIYICVLYAWAPKMLVIREAPGPEVYALYLHGPFQPHQGVLEAFTNASPTKSNS